MNRLPPAPFYGTTALVIPRAMLTIFHLRELTTAGREVLIRAESPPDAVELAAMALGIPPSELRDLTRFEIVEVNYGDDFRHAGPRGVIAVF